jgi:regulator of protease activity HflC (stomatin/prohibitin superfamily)
MQTQQENNKIYAKPTQGHISLGQPLRTILWFIPTVLLFLMVLLNASPARRVPGLIFSGGLSFIWGTIVSGIRVAAQWERCVALRLGRTLVINIPRQKVITRDNVPAEIDSALFFLVEDPEKAVISIQDFRFAASQYAQAALRDVIGGLTLDELLSEREQIQTQIAQIVEQQVKEWGLHIDSIRLQDIELPEDLKRMMSRQASAEREKRATITKADGDRVAAESLAKAAAIMESNPIALELRTLQTIDGLGASPSNTVILFPVEMSNMVEMLKDRKMK